MSKSFDVIMAGLMSGIVAITTGFLGLAGTVIGAVLGAILYQVISIFVKEPLENATVKKVEREIVYIIPLALIVVFLLIFLVALMQHFYLVSYPEFIDIFRQLEETTNNNLVRFMGIGLIVMGIYPLLQPNTIKRRYGATILVLGFILMIRGLLDVNPDFLSMYIEVFGFFDVVLNVVILLILVFIIIKILLESISLYMNRNESISFDGVSNNSYDLDNNTNDSNNSNNINNSNNTNNSNNNSDNKTNSSRNKNIKSDKTTTMYNSRKFFKR